MRTATLLLAAVLAGCAAAPQTQVPPPAATSSPAPAAKAAPGAKTAPPAGISAELYSRALENGYRAREHKGATLFCKTEAPIGSRIQKDTCVSVDQLEESIRQAELVRDRMRRGTTCAKADCGGG